MLLIFFRAKLSLLPLLLLLLLLMRIIGHCIDCETVVVTTVWIAFGSPACLLLSATVIVPLAFFQHTEADRPRMQQNFGSCCLPFAAVAGCLRLLSSAL